MARFKIDEAKNYGTGGNSIFFSLKEDKDSAKVRFLLNDINDLYGVSCHEVEDNGNRIDVECLRAYNEPIDKCPLCAAGYQPIAKLFIPLYNVELQKTQVWSRGKTYFERMGGLCAHYNPLVGTECEIERRGAKGDTNTVYNIYTHNSDDKKISDFPSITLENNAFFVKSFDEMHNYVKTGSFSNQVVQRSTPQVNSNNNQRQIPIRRVPTANDEEIF